MFVRLLMASIFSLAEGSMVGAQGLGPGDPDIVFECFANDQPAEYCQFSCGSELNQGGGKSVSWGNVSRVEIFHKGASGRSDERSFVFVRFRAAPGSPQAIAGLYIGPPIYCLADILSVGGSGVRYELRITKFRFN